MVRGQARRLPYNRRIPGFFVDGLGRLVKMGREQIWRLSMAARQSETPDPAAGTAVISKLPRLRGDMHGFALKRRSAVCRRAIAGSSLAPNKANFGLFRAEKGHVAPEQTQSGRAMYRFRFCFAFRDSDFGFPAHPWAGVSSFVQSKPNFGGGQNPSNLLTCNPLHRRSPAGWAPKQSQSKPICGARPVAMDGRAWSEYNGRGAGVQDRPGPWECLI